MANYIHEQKLESMVSKMWDEFYNVELYNNEFLNHCFLELFKYDRENRWILESDTNNDIWIKAHNEHYLILKIVGKLLVYINKPFEFIDELYKPWSAYEAACLNEKWGY